MAEQTAPPKVSEDGRFYWADGEWKPLPGAAPTATPPTSSRSKMPAILMLVGAAVAFVGTLLPWVRMSAALIGSLQKSGIEGDGGFIVVIAIIAVIVGLLGLSRPAKPGAVLVLLGGIAVLLIVGIDGSNIQSKAAEISSGRTGAIAEVGEGLYVSAAGGLLLVVSAIMALAAKPRA